MQFRLKRVGDGTKKSQFLCLKPANLQVFQKPIFGHTYYVVPELNERRKENTYVELVRNAFCNTYYCLKPWAGP